MLTDYTLTPSGLLIKRIEHDELNDTSQTVTKTVAFDRLHEYLSCVVELQDVKVATLFEIFQQNTVLQAIFARRHIQEYLAVYRQWLKDKDANKGANNASLEVGHAKKPVLSEDTSEDEPAPDAQYPIEQVLIEFADAGSLYPVDYFEQRAQVRGLKGNRSRLVNFPKDAVWDLSRPTLSLCGQSAVVKDDIRGKDGTVHHPEGRPIRWSLSFVPLTELLDKPLVVAEPGGPSYESPDGQAPVYNRFVIQTLKNQHLQLNVKVENWLTLWEILDLALREFSFHGDEASKSEEALKLKDIVASLDEYLEDDPTQHAVMLYSGQLDELLGSSTREHPYCKQLASEIESGDPSWLTLGAYLQAAGLSQAEMKIKEERGYLYEVTIHGEKKTYHRYPVWQLNITDPEFFRRIRLKSGHLSDPAFHRFCTNAHGTLESLVEVCTRKDLVDMPADAKKALLLRYQEALANWPGLREF